MAVTSFLNQATSLLGVSGRVAGCSSSLEAMLECKA